MKATINPLDPSQEQALKGVLNNKEDVAVIYGPPGTGKSHLILSLLFELATRGDKILFVSQNTDALDVITRMYRRLNKDLGIKEDSLSFLDFCWCLNEPAQRRVTYIKQQKNHIMEKPLETLPHASSTENEDTIPYALTYRELDKNDNDLAEPDAIGFDELLMSSLKNVHHDNIIKDILHTVPDESYRNALRLLNRYSDSDNLFCMLNHPKNALKYLNPLNTSYTLHEAQIIVEDLCDSCDGVVPTNAYTASEDINISIYISYVRQVLDYGSCINLGYFRESNATTKELLRMVNERVSIKNEIINTTTVKIPSTLTEQILKQKDDDSILKLDRTLNLKDYCKRLQSAKTAAELLINKYNVDGGIKFKYVYGCVFDSFDFNGVSDINPSTFRTLGYNSLTKLIEELKSYNSKNKLAKIVYRAPEDIKMLDKKSITPLSGKVEFLEYLSKILNGTNARVKDIIDGKNLKPGSIIMPIEMDQYDGRPNDVIEISNATLKILNANLKSLSDKSLREINKILSRQINDIKVLMSILFENKDIEFESINSATEIINQNINNLNVSKRRSLLDASILPFLTKKDGIEKECSKIIEISNQKIELEKLLASFVPGSAAMGADLEKMDKVEHAILDASQKNFFSKEFFTVHANENIGTWEKHVKTILDYNRLDEFDAYIRQNHFMNDLRAALSDKNAHIIDSYIKDEDITYDEFCEHLTKDIVGTIYENAPASVRKTVSKKYFSDFKENHKKLQVMTYLSGLQKLKLDYEDPARVLSYSDNWRKPKTNIEKIKQNSEMIIDAFPVTIATPADVSKYIVAKKELFDFIIFDEASQLLPGQALPSIYRAKKAVVVGDPHQMPPTLTVAFGFNGGVDDNDDDDVSNELSILDLAKNLQLDATYHLKVHYRSESNMLFEPSRKVIYAEDGVKPIFEARSNSMPLYIEDNLGDDDKKNFAIIARRVEYYLSKNENTSFCLLFSRSDKQGLYGFKKYLEESGDSTISKLYENDKLLISTVTNCQGIEGDHTILYLPHYSSPRAMWFFKETAGAYKRLNVTITRQRQTLDVIMGDPRGKWLQACQDFLNSNNCGPNQRKSAELLNALLSNAGQEINEEYLEKSLGPNSQNIDSPLTQQLYDKLNDYYSDRIGKDMKIWCEVGWNMLIPDVESIGKNNRNVGYRIDIGIYSITQKRFVLGIEMDGATYHSGFIKEFSDLQRQDTLERKGWSIYRIWSTNWLQDTQKEFENLTSTIDKLLSVDAVDDTPAFNNDYNEKNDYPNDDGVYHLGSSSDAEDDEDSVDDPARFSQQTIFESENISTAHRLTDYESPAVFRKDLVLVMNNKMKVGKPVEMKYSNSSLTYEQIQAAPYQPIFVKDINSADDFFLGSFSLTGSPYRIKLSDVFEYKE